MSWRFIPGPYRKPTDGRAFGKKSLWKFSPVFYHGGLGLGHIKLNTEVSGIVFPPPGMVAPYPEFFSGLAKLTRETAAAFEKAGLARQFDVKTEANALVNDLKLT